MNSGDSKRLQGESFCDYSMNPTSSTGTPPVFLAREEDQSYFQHLTASLGRGAKIFFKPILEISFREDFVPEALSVLSDNPTSGVIFSSSNAVLAMFNMISEESLLKQLLFGRKGYFVGRKTAERAKSMLGVK
eukprot:gene10095-2263_t